MSTNAPSGPNARALAGSTVLVTGGAGFIGSHLVDALAPIATVRVLDDCSTGNPANVHDDATLHVGDVTDDETVAAVTSDVDYVFHLAAIPTVPDSMAAPARNVDVNTAATASLLEHADEADARLVFASSAAVYGKPSEVPIPETASKTPRNPYGVAKLASDQYVRGYAEWFDVPTVALRFFNVFGPRQQQGVVPAFVNRARMGDPIVVHGDGEQTRDFVHVDDVVSALVAAATTDATGEAFNVGRGESTSIRKLAEYVRDAAQTDVDVVHDDPRPADIKHSQADASKARRELDFEPTVSIEDGLRELLERAPVLS